jgi:hypothetical protein
MKKRLIENLSDEKKFIGKLILEKFNKISKNHKQKRSFAN